MSTQATIPAGNKRVIGPIPPRDKHGKMLIGPIMEKRAKLNILGEPARDKDNNPVEEVADVRPPLEYLSFDGTQRPAENATRGLRLFQVDYGIEPSLLVYARNEHDAIDVYKKEWGILRFGETDPVVNAVE